LSDIVRRRVVLRGSDGTITTLGTVRDFVVDEPNVTYPAVSGFVVGTSSGLRYAVAETLADITDSGDIVLTTVPTLPPPPDEKLYLVEDLFDKQIVDTNGRKVVRINDLEVANVTGTLRVVAADIGLTGLLQRLGIRKFLGTLGDRNSSRSLISWDAVSPIDDVNPSIVTLRVAESKLSRLHPSDLAEIIADLSTGDALRVIGQLDDETAADALEHLDPETQRAIIAEVGTARAADIIEEMDSDDAADLLNELPEDQQETLFAEMDTETAGELRELVAFDDDEAGGLMTTDFVWIYAYRTVGATIEKIREIAPESEFIYYLYVVDADQKLQGVLSLRTLLLAQPTVSIESIMEREVIHVTPQTHSDEVASTIARYDLLALPVVDPDGTMRGIVTIDDAIDHVIPEKLKRQLPRLTRRHANAHADRDLV
jgi:CBS domain-containing protein/sporulation protein YlmC with PRC-barrel domain